MTDYYNGGVYDPRGPGIPSEPVTASYASDIDVINQAARMIRAMALEMKQELDKLHKQAKTWNGETAIEHLIQCFNALSRDDIAEAQSIVERELL